MPEYMVILSLALGIYIFGPIQEIKHLIFGQIAMKEIGTNVNTRSREVEIFHKGSDIGLDLIFPSTTLGIR